MGKLNGYQRGMLLLLQTDNDGIISPKEIAERFDSKVNRRHARTLRSLVRLGILRRSGSFRNRTYSMV